MASNDPELTHLDAAGAAQMVDVGHKPPLRRTAIACGFLVAAEATLDRVMVGDLPKGEALAVARTGVEMEALTAVSVALLTLWDMVKGIDSNLVIEGIRLLEKRKEPTT